MSDILLLGAGRGGYSEGGGGGGGGGGGEVTYTVSASLDDGYFKKISFSNTFPSTFTSIHKTASTAQTKKDYDDDGSEYDYRKGYFRFQNINISQGTTIQSAFFKPIYKNSSWTSTMKMVGTDVDNVSAPSLAGDGNTSLHTSAIVEWANPPSHSTNYQTSPDIKTIIQEIVDRSGWSAGNAIMIQSYYDAAGYANNSRQARSWDDTSSGASQGDYAAQLVITT